MTNSRNRPHSERTYTNVCASFPKELHVALMEAARQADTSVSAWLREAAIEKMERDGIVPRKSKGWNRNA